jgi:hypothetical protein
MFNIALSTAELSGAFYWEVTMAMHSNEIRLNRKMPITCHRVI